MRCVKVRYPTEAAAESCAALDARVVAVTRGITNQKPLRSYRCNKCGGWHLTSQGVK